MPARTESTPLETLRALIAQRLGLAVEEDRLDFLDAVLRARAEETGMAPAAYCDALSLSNSPDEITAVAQMITVGETYFFRHATQLEACRDRVLRDRKRAAGARKIRILSAACSTGEEPYSLAMMFRNHASEVQVEITAVDINPASLERARLAVYSPWSLRETAEPLQARWFRREGRTLLLDRAIVNDVTLLQGNLNVDDPAIFRPEYYDVVLCRNALMYFTPEAYRGAIDRIARSLAPGGFLFLGHAETLRGISHDFHLCHTHDTFYYQRKGSLHAHPEPTKANAAPGRRERQQEPPVAIDDNWVNSIRQSADRVESIALTSGGVRAPAGVQREANLAGVFDLMERDRGAEALAAVQAMTRDASDDADTLLLKATLFMQEGRFAEAELACRQLLELDELHAGAQYILAMCCEGRGDRDGAMQHNQIAIYLDPTFAMPRFHLGMLQRRAGNRPAARQEFLKAQSLLEREDLARLLMFGGGFGRTALLALCRAELAAGDAA